MDRDNFVIAFSDAGTTLMYCRCGKIYCTPRAWHDMTDAEFERLKKDPSLVEVDYDGIGVIEYEGQQFADCCSCWAERAERLMMFIDGHAKQIADYLKLEKERKIQEAESSAVVD